MCMSGLLVLHAHCNYCRLRVSATTTLPVPALVMGVELPDSRARLPASPPSYRVVLGKYISKCISKCIRWYIGKHISKYTSA